VLLDHLVGVRLDKDLCGLKPLSSHPRVTYGAASFDR